MEETNTEQLNFIFTLDSFKLDNLDNSLDVNYIKPWNNKNKFNTLYELGLNDMPKGITLTHAYLYQISKSFFSQLLDNPDIELLRENIEIEYDKDEIERIKNSAPYAIGAEFITNSWIKNIYVKLLTIFKNQIKAFKGTVQEYITEKNLSLHVPERIFFHLVENKEDESYPFAFLATYASKISENKVKHFPLSYALTEFKNTREKLLELLSCLNKAADVSQFISNIMDNGNLFHPIKLTSEEAYSFLKDVEKIEDIGILCRIPNWWKTRSSKVSVNVTLGNKKPSFVGMNAILNTYPELEVNGVKLTKQDIEELLQQSDGLYMLKGKWVEVDKEKLTILLHTLDKYKGDISLLDALAINRNIKDSDVPDIDVTVSNGKWLNEILANLKDPSTIKSIDTPIGFKGELRKYQKEGYAWLTMMDSLNLGACLSDDMGLGKTIQVLAYIDRILQQKTDAKFLLIIPATLIGNWKSEIEKFTPNIKSLILHGKTSTELAKDLEDSSYSLTITTYGIATKLKELTNYKWDCIILDEAQAIKNPTTKQSKSIKEIPAKMHIAMTGTPIENDLTNLWSLFDFLDRGFLGSFKEFSKFCKKLDDEPENYLHLKGMVNPFMLRRLKTDKNIISDLPDKFETIDYVTLSKSQVVLYNKVLDDTSEKLMESDGIARKGLILSTILKLKQICNHPDQFLGNKAFYPDESGKFETLKQLCETIKEKRERVLVFTQFKEMTQPLADYLQTIFNAPGFIIDGDTPIKKRQEYVNQFQSDEYYPFFVLSIKAGGTGLNLTNANHVIHFDRWWNPAVENQATDRAFRIGQSKNVLVHKLVSTGTVEERIDQLIESKKELANKIIAESGEKWITELNNDELMDLLTLGGDYK